ncbi:Leucine-rich repeat-containing protein 75A [Acipenser ruthenus]|uniref:Leucine-rich repeat-containing protein 75A n=1 Tax=Acipenser ruthenus TaxID=7906 RepID=A0A444USM2_ACIRT|nr:Leucine-rich repeat-containing protein 75A [Acipenser ruthenus]
MNSGSLGGVEGVCDSFEARRFQGLEKNSQEETSAPGPPHLLAVLDLGMESTSLDDVLYRYASFRNLVDPITHDLILSLARYIHCPKTVGRRSLH